MKNKFSKRGLSSIIGTLLMVAVVATVGSVIMFQGMNGINDFNYYLSFLTGSNNASHENAVIEHVRFTPDSNIVDIWIRNTGTVQLEISKITVVRMDTQELLLTDNPDRIISLSSVEDITTPAIDINGVLAGTPNWEDDPAYLTSYRISFTTSKGNSFETTVTPYNS